MTQEVWFSGVDRDAMKQDLALASRAFDRLKKILESKRIIFKSNDYDKHSWPFFRADADGYNRALEEVLKLIKED